MVVRDRADPLPDSAGLGEGVAQKRRLGPPRLVVDLAIVHFDDDSAFERQDRNPETPEQVRRLGGQQ